MRKQPNAMNLPRSNEAEQALTLEAGVQLRSAQGWEDACSRLNVPGKNLESQCYSGSKHPIPTLS